MFWITLVAHFSVIISAVLSSESGPCWYKTILKELYVIISKSILKTSHVFPELFDICKGMSQTAACNKDCLILSCQLLRVV